jgi:hypothetical protein
MNQQPPWLLIAAGLVGGYLLHRHLQRTQQVAAAPPQPGSGLPAVGNVLGVPLTGGRFTSTPFTLPDFSNKACGCPLGTMNLRIGGCGCSPIRPV